MIIPINSQMVNFEFFEFLKDGIADLLKEFFQSKSNLDIKVLRDDLLKLNKRYSAKLTVKQYYKALIDSIDIRMHNDNLLIGLSPKSRFYKIIKSIELGSYQVTAISLLGQVLAIMPSLVDRLFTDYEIVKEKLDYYRIADSVYYRILMRHSLYDISNRLKNKVKLF